VPATVRWLEKWWRDAPHCWVVQPCAACALIGLKGAPLAMSDQGARGGAPHAHQDTEDLGCRAAFYQVAMLLLGGAMGAVGGAGE
jgi:hypothetical protein